MGDAGFKILAGCGVATDLGRRLMIACPPRLKIQTEYPVLPSGRVGIADSGLAASANTSSGLSLLAMPAIAALPTIVRTNFLRESLSSLFMISFAFYGLEAA